MGGNTIVRAPYNFVPFSKKVLRYEGAVPAQDVIDPSLKTGEIHVTLTADTPVFVSDGNRDDPHFFRGANGRFQLPGSTIRGMVRQNMQILGFGLIRPGEDFEDRRVFYRKIADARQSTGGELKTYYHNAVAVKTLKSASGKSYSIPQNVHAGYLRKTEHGYAIQPVRGTYFKVSRKHPDCAALGDASARAVPVAYTAAGDQIKLLCPAEAGGPEMERGVLLYTGKPIRPDKPNHLYLFPEADEDAAPVPVSKEDELSYAADWEGRRNSLKAYYDPNFWKLPQAGEEKPVFYIQHNSHTYFGMSLYLRIGYRFSLQDGLRAEHRDRQEKEPEFLDFPRAILGYAEEKRSRRSRVSFGDFPAQGDPEEQPLVETVLGAPKISYYPGYVESGEHYNQDGFQLRGYKLYWLKDVRAEPTDKKNAASKLRPLPAGTVFSGVIRYKNLRPEELGLLLWALRLEDGCYQSVGMGKPYGFGRMKLTIDSLREYDFQALYAPGGLCGGPAEAPAGVINRYIDAYDALAAKAMYLKKPKKKPSIRSRSEIEDFLYMHSAVQEPENVSYMTLPEYQNVGSPLPTVETMRKAAEEKRREAETAKGPSLEDLRNHFRKN